MKTVIPVLRALFSALRREQQSRITTSGNNLYYAAAASMFLMDPAIAGFVAILVVIVVFFPLSADPLRLIPRSRLQLWPLTRNDRRLLRAISPWLNPISWLVAAFVLWRRVSTGAAALAASIFLIAFVTPQRRRASGRGVFAWIPRFPGRLGELIRKNLRGLLTTLDFYCALVPAVAAVGYRLAGLLPADAHLPGTCIVLLCISTPSQALFGLDGRGGLTRYRLMPLAGWRILLAKDIAFLLAAIALAAALSPFDAACGALVALALGRKASLYENKPQLRWRLQSGASFGPAVVQIILMLGAASFAQFRGPLVLIPCLAIWAISLWWGGRILDSGAGIADSRGAGSARWMLG